ncbi:MAG: DUF3516 domain-containing protein [Myxococcota bacterium]|nr:DEAD/DEAH box helicase [Deltaproteobacteria bacterium]MCP4239761.1 DUF3516 domain-containing protein [bacterium]MDP6074479.1 DUF3516 domain-containing protein [Myxococcota bacterium]MDP6241723.1 DUF3516 domain-containing protein [Myxococcota bacterium]MDP7073864.1 DUF3516 domain-containing protein [Myxococcota bacterium]
MPSPLHARIPEGGLREPEEILDRFLDWVHESGLEPYAEQDEAFLELALGRHVVLSTPTGSGKSLVAQALHFKALCEGRRSFYTSPVKALASEKFFEWCEVFGPENVGMLTGDASVNRDAPVICCTAEVLSNMCLRRGEAADAPYVVMDEFHYYDDRDRGAAWQIPLLVLGGTQFLLMSATLGNTAVIEAHLQERTRREVRHIHSDVRPVPLDYEYRETPLHETLEDLAARGLTPVYVVSFTQRECGERAQALTSANLATREQRRAVSAGVGDFRFDTPYGKDLQRFLRFGVAVHHAGLLPRYRLLVEKLAQRGLLQVVCGTDTLGVGVNVPIRTVLFTQLCKFDGEKVAALRVREFKQIAGRAGRRGFDDRGAVVCQAPDHVIENLRARSKGGRRAPKRRPPGRGIVPWNRDSFEKLIEKPPESLRSRFAVTHGMVVSVLQREEEEGHPDHGYRALVDLVNRSHESEKIRALLRRRAATVFRSLHTAGVVQTVFDAESGRRRARVSPELQIDFSLHRNLSLWLLEALEGLDPDSPSHGLEVVSLAEAIQDNPFAILLAQRGKRKRELLAELKRQRVPYDERIAKLDEVGWPKPDEAYIEETFRLFREVHPWVGEDDVRPKGVAREMLEGWRDFVDYVKEYGIARSEGLLLRYLSQVHGTLVRNVPEAHKTDALYDAVAYLRTLLSDVDSSLVEAWETLLEPAPDAVAPGGPGLRPFDLSAEPRALAARVRAELHSLVRDLAARDYAAALRRLRSDGEPVWDAAGLEEALAPFCAEFGGIDVTPRSRQANLTRIAEAGPRCFDVAHVLCDPKGDDLWAIYGEVDLTKQRDPEGPLFRLVRVGT